MILGVGLDLVSIHRMRDLVARHGQRFLDRCFVPGEVPTDLQDPLNLQILAQAWCLKEAFLKALGGAIQGIPYRDITVRAESRDRPVVAPTGSAGRALTESGASGVLAFASATWPWVAGSVILTLDESRESKGLGGDAFV